MFTFLNVNLLMYRKKWFVCSFFCVWVFQKVPFVAGRMVASANLCFCVPFLMWIDKSTQDLARSLTIPTLKCHHTHSTLWLNKKRLIFHRHSTRHWTSVSTWLIQFAVLSTDVVGAKWLEELGIAFKSIWMQFY